MNILTIINEDDSLTRMFIHDDPTATATAELLTTLGYALEHGYGDEPQRPRDELDRLNAVLDVVYNHILETSGIAIPKPPRL